MVTILLIIQMVLTIALVAVTLANQKEMLLTMNLLQSQLYSLQTQQAVTLHRLRHTLINTT